MVERVDPIDIDAVAEARYLDETKRYLDGRRLLAELPLAALGDLDSHVQEMVWLSDDEGPNAMADALAEFRLRGVDPPYDHLHSELEALKEEFRTEGPLRRNMRATINAFLEKLDERFQ